MTEVSLHRCRFVDYPPAHITCLSFSHESSTSPRPPPKSLRLAIGRANGSIDIWNPLGGIWHHEVTLAGAQDRSIESVVWTQDYDPHGLGALRLFSIGYSSVVTEWDLATGKPRTHENCNGGAIWSIATQPRRNSTDFTAEEMEDEEALAQKIAVGTEDGTVKLLSTAGGPGGLTFQRNLVGSGSKKARVLSLVWKDRHTLVAGMADSVIRVFDIRSGRSVGRMTLNKIASKKTLCWALKVTPNGDAIISGDSQGEICIWDAGNYTLRQRIKSHHGDCLTLEVMNERIFSAGVDMKTVMYSSVKGKRWAEVAHRRFHRHDVTALAAYQCGRYRFAISGSVDMTAVILPLKDFNEPHRTLPYVPQLPIVTTVPDSRILMSHWEREVRLWRLGELSEYSGDDSDILRHNERGRKLISRLVLGNEEFITSSAIVPLRHNAGYLLAVATSAELKLFHLRSPKPHSDALRVTKVAIPESLLVKSTSPDNNDDDDPEDIDLSAEGARLVKFSPDGEHLLIVTPESRLLIATVSFTLPDNPKSKPTIELSQPIISLEREDLSPAVLKPPAVTATTETPTKKPNKRLDEGNHGSYMHTITKATFSSTSRLLAVADLAGNVSTFIFSPIAFEWTPTNAHIPKLTSAPAILAFRPPSPPAPLAIEADKPPEKPSTESDDDDDDEELNPVPSTGEPDEKLLIITADSHQILEFFATTGRLTPWSRRNPKPPADFLTVKDRAVDAFFESWRRVWVWGSSWVWMFDLERDFPQPSPTSTSLQKRKRSSSSTTDKPKKPVVNDDSDDEDNDDEEEEEQEESEDEDQMEVDGDMAVATTNKKGRRRGGRGGKEKKEKPFWRTHKYRNLLGFCPLGKMDVVQAPGMRPGMEVAVVERPQWDVQLPPRFYKGS